MPLLYGARGGAQSTSNLYTVNPATGGLTSVGPIGFALTGLAFSPGGVLYGATSNNSVANPVSLITVNTTTGAGTLVGPLGIAFSAADIAFRGDGVLFGWSQAGDKLYTINTSTGAATSVGGPSISGFGYGMDFDSSGTLWLFPLSTTGNYYTINPATGVGTLVGTLGGPGSFSVQAASFNSSDVLYVIAQSITPSLRIIDVTTGGVTTIGNTISSFDALAWEKVFPTGPPVNVAPPTISGTVEIGETLTSTTGSWTGAQPITYARQWQLCDSAGNNCVDIPGETGTTYVVQGTDGAKTIRVCVTATNAEGSVTACSASTSIIPAVRVSFDAIVT